MPTEQFDKVLDLFLQEGGKRLFRGDRRDQRRTQQGNNVDYRFMDIQSNDILQPKLVNLAKTNMAWVSDITKRGMLRINAHGDGTDHIITAEKVDVTMEQLVEFLVKNGLQQQQAGDKGLRIIYLAVCEAAMGRTRGDSLIGRLVKCLRARAVLGVRVIGAYFETGMADGVLEVDVPDLGDPTRSSWESIDGTKMFVQTT